MTRLSLLPIGLSFALWLLAAQAVAECQYRITNDWGSGFTAAIRLTNTGDQAINGWQITWQYSGTTNIEDVWNAHVSGNNPYTAVDAGWNAAIAPGQSVEFGLRGSGSAEIPTLSGAVCSNAPSSSSASSSSQASESSSSSQGVSSSSVPPSSSSSSSSQFATVHKGLAVIVDFADTTLEDHTGEGFSSEQAIAPYIDEAIEHWQWLSLGRESFSWDRQRITLSRDLAPDSYASWRSFREEITQLIKTRVNPADYDRDNDGEMDAVWAIVSANGQDPVRDSDDNCTAYCYLLGGASWHNGVNIFVDLQHSPSITGGHSGNLTHELAHLLFRLPDLYGDYSTIADLSLMAYSWSDPDFDAWSRSQIGWLEPTVITESTQDVYLPDARDSFAAIKVPTAHSREYFLIEYRRRPESGFGSTTTDFDGLAVYHVLEGSAQGNSTPLLKLEPADGAIEPGAFPAANDLLYPGNPAMPAPFVARSYYGDQPVLRIDNLRWSNQGIRFDLEVLPIQQTANLLLNPSFEFGSGSWLGTQQHSGATHVIDTAQAQSGNQSAQLEALALNDARWEQTVNNLNIGEDYMFCGHIKGQNVAGASDDDDAVGANLSLLGGFTRSDGLTGSFDWTEQCVSFTAENSSEALTCRLGFYYSEATGKIWCDKLELRALTSPF